MLHRFGKFRRPVALVMLSVFLVAQLLSIHEEMRACLEADAREEYEALDERFHDLITRSAANEVLVEHIEDCKKTVAAVRHASMESHASLDGVFAEHERIVAAIRAGDAEEARLAMSGHIRLRGDVASHLIATWQQQNQTSEAPA